MSIEITELTCIREGAVTVDEASMSVARGEIHALLGPSGAGKTTLLRAVGGLLRPAGGTVVLGGRAVVGPGTWVPPQERNVSLVFQSLALWPHMSVASHLSFAMGRMDKSSKKEGIRKLLADVRLAGMERRRPGNLSGGERQRLAIARALASGPQVLLLDEPMSHLDDALRHSLLELVRGLARDREVTVLYVTHSLDEALFLADSLSFIRRGRIERRWRNDPGDQDIRPEIHALFHHEAA
ncbi:MAG: ABC transporter ATP-binding protein [Desulfatibacillaceae bacterium]